MKTALIKELNTILKNFPEFWSEGSLSRSIVIDALINKNQELLRALIGNDKIKEIYATNIDGVMISDSEKLIALLKYKEHWADSFTKYRNKIGLTSEGKYFEYNTDVVLDFPFKDCVLEGGMTKEQEGKDEVYYNEIIARDEIDRLFSPKVLSKAKRYTKEGVEENITSFSDDDNLIIKGNNLVALHSLKERYEGKVKLIYIDPPYLFKKRISQDNFKYNSNFHKSTWLTFLRNRLQVARELLSDNGSIWIHMNDEGMHYLKVLADDVFGENHFVATLPRKIRDGKSDVPFNLSQEFDWILVYTKASESDYIFGREVERKYYETEDFPGRPWRTADLTKQTTIKERPNSNFTMVNPKTAKEYPVNPKRSWAVTMDTFESYYSKGGIGFPDDYDFMDGERPFRRIFKEEDDEKQKQKPSAVNSDFLVRNFIKDLMLNTKNKDGNDEIDALFGRDEFDYAKPENLIMSMLKVVTKEKDLILDFFMGSGTTQAVAHKMNRQYIGIEQMDYINELSVPRLQKVIEGEQGGISKEVNWQGGGSFVYAELMELNYQFIHKINEASHYGELEELFELMKVEAHLNYQIELDQVLQTEYELDGVTQLVSFADLPLVQQKQLLIELLDKNQLYVNASEMDDIDMKVDGKDRLFTQSFYGLDKKVL